MKYKPSIIIDFDGVIHSYVSKWVRADVIPDPPVLGAVEALVEYSHYYNVHIFSSRSRSSRGRRAMKEYVFKNIRKEWGETFDTEGLMSVDEVLKSIHFPDHKPPSIMSIDDRGLTFRGVFPSVDLIHNFVPWNKKFEGKSHGQDT